MNFRYLNKEIQQGIKALTIDDEFQKRFGSDKILDDLDEQKYNPAQELLILQSLVENKITIQGRTIYPITPKIWSFLWIIDSPFINSKKEVKELDIDIFMYLLENNISEINPTKILTDSIGYCLKNDLTYQDGYSIIKQATKIAFKPLNLFPKMNISGNIMMVYDSEWLTGTVAKVHAVTGLTPDQIMNLSLSTICLYFAQFSKLNGAENIYRRSSEEILKAQDERCCELIVQRLIEKGVIKPEQRQTIFKIISTPEQEQYNK